MIQRFNVYYLRRGIELSRYIVSACSMPAKTMGYLTSQMVEILPYGFDVDDIAPDSSGQ